MRALAPGDRERRIVRAAESHVAARLHLVERRFRAPARRGGCAERDQRNVFQRIGGRSVVDRAQRARAGPELVLRLAELVAELIGEFVLRILGPGDPDRADRELGEGVRGLREARQVVPMLVGDREDVDFLLSVADRDSPSPGSWSFAASGVPRTTPQSIISLKSSWPGRFTRTRMQSPSPWRYTRTVTRPPLALCAEAGASALAEALERRRAGPVGADFLCRLARRAARLRGPSRSRRRLHDCLPCRCIIAKVLLRPSGSSGG